MTGITFRQQERDRRLPAYQTGEDTLSTLSRMNALLAPGEPTSWSGIPRPNLFIFGLPRSGTTLTYQLLSYCLNIGYINNLAARFWQAPVTGTILARTVLGDRRDGSFRSDYGKSLDPAGPHEFSYFWQERLGMHTVEQALRFGGNGLAVDWDQLRTTLGCVQDVFGLGLVHKTNWAANVAGGIVHHLPMPLFIHIQRHPLAVALSILKARNAYYGRAESWWATYPPTYREIAGLPFADQIARQVVDLRATYDAVLDGLDPALVVRVDYEDLCRDPGAVVDQVRDQVRRTHGVEIGKLNAAPTHFAPAPVPLPDSPQETAVACALKAALPGAP